MAWNGDEDSGSRLSGRVTVERVMKRNNMSREQVTAIMAAQATRQQRLAIADDVIVNDKSVGEVLKEVVILHAKYTEMAQKTGL